MVMATYTVIGNLGNLGNLDNLGNKNIVFANNDREAYLEFVAIFEARLNSLLPDGLRIEILEQLHPVRVINESNYETVFTMQDYNEAWEDYLINTGFYDSDI